jgi:hypothetical protein
VDTATTSPPVPEAASRTAAAASSAIGVVVDSPRRAGGARVAASRVRSYGGRHTGRGAGTGWGLAFRFALAPRTLFDVDSGVARDATEPAEDAVVAGRVIPMAARRVVTGAAGVSRRDAAGELCAVVELVAVAGGSGLGVTGWEDALAGTAVPADTSVLARAGRTA